MSRQPNGGFIGRENITDNTQASGIYNLSEVGQKIALNEYPPARFTPSRSLRFGASRTTYLYRTLFPASSGGQAADTSQLIKTYSVWVKRGVVGTDQMILSNYTAAGNLWQLAFDTTNRLYIFDQGLSVTRLNKVTTQVFGDPTAWYHFVVEINTTLPTAEDRYKLYVNGSRITSFSTNTIPGQNVPSASYFVPVGGTWNASIGFRPNGSFPFDGYMSEFNAIDGQALGPTNFGEFDSRTGEWKPKRYTGTYGNSGFYLPFRNDNFYALGTDNKTTVSDSLTATSHGGGSLTTSTVKYGTAAFNLSGGGYVWPGGAGSGYGTHFDEHYLLNKDFTIEFWYRGQASDTNFGSQDGVLTGYNYLVSKGRTNSSNRGWGIQLDSNGAVGWDEFFAGGSAAVYTTGVNVLDNQWHHIAFSRNAGTLRIYVDGTQYGSGSINNNTDNTYGLVINGMWDYTNGNTLTYKCGGTMDDFRMYTGIAKYTSNFTAPTAALPLGAEDPYWNFVSAALPLDGSNGATSFPFWKGNYWTSSAHALTDSMVDSPVVGTQVTNDIGGVVRGNYCTFNPLAKRRDVATNVTFANANLQATFNDAGGNVTHAWGTIYPTAGKYYWEITVANNASNLAIGIGSQPDQDATANTSVIYLPAGGIFRYGVSQTTAASYTTNDIIGIAYDVDSATVAFYKNNSLQFTVTGVTVIPSGPFTRGSTNDSLIANFGQRPFVYTPPTGFKSLCTTNLPEPTIKRAQEQFDIKLWRGSGASQTIGNTARQTDNYQISRSLRFNYLDSHFLNRTFASAGNRKTWTWSGWVKRSSFGINNYLFSGGTGGGDTTQNGLKFETDDTLVWTGAATLYLRTRQVFKDPSAWYHVVLTFDTTQSNANDRIRMYVNGLQITEFSTVVSTTQNLDYGINQAAEHNIGRWTGASNPLDGYLAEVNFVDGQALTPEAFGVFDVDGSWQAKRYTGTYGTNGYYLDFSDNSNTTATTLGKDRAGSNNWTPNNFSVAAGTGNDSVVDVPTNWDSGAADVGGNVRGSYPTLGTKWGTTKPGYSNGNLVYNTNTTSSNNTAFLDYLPPTGKWYWEYTVIRAVIDSGIAYALVAISDESGGPGSSYYWWVYSSPFYEIRDNTTGVSQTVPSIVTGDVINFAIDMDTGNYWYGKNGTWLLSGNPNTNTKMSGITSLTPNADRIYPYIDGRTGSLNNIVAVNFGQTPFIYTPPTGFKSLNTRNINEQTPFASGPDLVWIKNRNTSNSHIIGDTVRGALRYVLPSGSDAELTLAETITQFTSNGFVVGNNSATNGLNNQLVSWCWNAGSRTVGNQDGTITSTVRANPAAGFSIVSYTGTGANGTVGHGLGVAPKMILVKRRDAINDWAVQHTSVPATQVLTFNTTAVATTASTFQNMNPLSSTFSIAGISTATNSNGGTYVAYCWSEVPGYSKFGSYTGNGSNDGPYVHLGFRPKWIMIKRTDATSNWEIIDTTRNSYGTASGNPVFLDLSANVAGGENASDGTTYVITSNGFKITDGASSGTKNASGGNYVYAAFAEMPSRYALAR